MGTQVGCVVKVGRRQVLPVPVCLAWPALPSLPRRCSLLRTCQLVLPCGMKMANAGWGNGKGLGGIG